MGLVKVVLKVAPSGVPLMLAVVVAVHSVVTAVATHLIVAAQKKQPLFLVEREEKLAALPPESVGEWAEAQVLLQQVAAQPSATVRQ
jgi:hypothetical protein